MDIAHPPRGYTARPAVPEDAAAVADLINTCQLADGDQADLSPEDVLSDWEGSNLEEESVVVIGQDGTLAASADIVNRRYVQLSMYGYVRPEHRGRGLGAFLVNWGEVWAQDRMHLAPENARVLVQHYLRESNNSARRMLESLGYLPVRWYYWMGIEMSEPPPAPAPPAGVRVRTFRTGQDEHAVFDAVEEAFRDTWGRVPGEYDRWLDLTASERRDPELWFLAEDEADGRIAGACLSRVTANEGYIGTVGVRRPWRGRGLGLALLRYAFGECYRRGSRKVQLSVDAESATGAPRLYFRAGMHVIRSYVMYRKLLRPGEDMSAHLDEE